MTTEAKLTPFVRNRIKTRETQTNRGGVSGFLYSFIYHFPTDQPYLALITLHEKKIKEAMEVELNRIIIELTPAEG